MLVGLTSEFATEVCFPEFRDPGVEQDWIVLVTVTVLYLGSIFVFVLKTVTYEGTGFEELLGSGWTLPEGQIVMDITHCALSCARATAARKRVKKTA